MRPVLLRGALAFLLLSVGCARAPHRASPAATHPTSAPVAPTPPPAPIEPAPIAPTPAPVVEATVPVSPITIKVPGDKSVLVVPGETSTPIVYLHGRCGNPSAFVAWAQVGRKFGTIISLVGDIKCKSGSRTQWTEDTGAIDRRITAALSAVKAELGIELNVDERIIMGYSQGSLKAEALASRFPERYPRAVLIAGPRGPRDGSLRKTHAILFMVGDHDARDHLREAARKLQKHGKTVRYIELPGAHHGEYGPDAEARMSAGLEWLLHA